MSTARSGRIWTANRLGLNYREGAQRLGKPVVPIVDIHAHIGGRSAPRIYAEVAALYGVRVTYSMTQHPQAGAVRDLLGDRVRFIAFPTWADADKNRAHRQGYLEVLEKFRRDFDARMMKVWASPRLRDVVPDLQGTAYGATDLAEVDSAWRVRACEAAERLGMMYMIHIADPDTWFAAKYKDPARYGTKRQQYEGFERMLDRFTSPWIAAHMGGWPEDLAFLDGLLRRHPNLYIDTSATKWVVRELSKHEPAETAAFFARWRGRLLFGSDLVVTDDHLQPAKATTSPMADLADSPDAAWELYASRYWALRTMFETDYDGQSPIADPDLAMIEPEKYDGMSGPRLRGMRLPTDVLRDLYANTAEDVVGAWERAHP